MRSIALALLLGGLAAALPARAQESGTAPATPAADAASVPAQPSPTAARPRARATALVDGLWCGSGPLHDYSLRLTQHEQDVAGELARPGRTRTIEGRMEGNVLRTQATKVGALVLEHLGDKLKITGGDGPIALARGQVFHRSDSGSCTG